MGVQGECQKFEKKVANSVHFWFNDQDKGSKCQIRLKSVLQLMQYILCNITGARQLLLQSC